jgi:HEAT repeat protein
LHAYDPGRDVAVLKLSKAAPKKLPLATRPPSPGTKIYVIGTPLGFLNQTISEGIVSGVRQTRDEGTLLQITAAISPGSSGSPVLNTSGQVVGMVTGSIEEGQSLNFAVASAEIQRSLPTITILSPSELDSIINEVVTQADAIEKLVSKLSGEWGDEAARKLSKIGYPAIDALKDAASSKQSVVRRRAVDAIIRMLSDPDENVRRMAAWALGGNKDTRAVEPLIRALSEPDRDVRMSAAWALGEIRDKRAVESLQRSTYDIDSGVQVAAWSALWAIDKRQQAVAPLIRALPDPDWVVRWHAASALGEIKDRRAVEPLIRALSDPDEYVRSHAAWALGEINDKRAVEPLIRVLSDPVRNVRLGAAEALGKTKDKRAIAPLRLLLTDASSDVRKAAQEAIRKIEGG